MFRITNRTKIYNPKNLYYIKRNYNHVVEFKNLDKNSPIHLLSIDNRKILLNDYSNNIDKNNNEDYKNNNNIDKNNNDDYKYYNQNFKLKGGTNWIFEW
jgi:hypothetical protein